VVQAWGREGLPRAGQEQPGSIEKSEIKRFEVDDEEVTAVAARGCAACPGYGVVLEGAY
jgi:hypothetical protein